MPGDTMAQRILPHLRRVALARDADTGDGSLLGEFVTSQDETAFATLVRRHGPMVLGVCRRVIGDPHLAEDAFQATFLVLARRAASVRPRHLVGHWLYGVAYRTALKARGTAAKRRLREQQVPDMPQPAISPEDAWSDLQPVLDAELARLPEKLRVPVVLCDLGGRPQREVARELKLPPATLANRLASARRLLARRLGDRGIVLSASAISAALTWHASTSAVSPTLACATAKAACAAASGKAIGLSAPVVELSDGVMRMFVLKKLKALALSCLLVLGGVGFLASSSLHANPDGKPASSPKPDAPKAAESEDAKVLRKLCLELRGNEPTGLELSFFTADRDPKKRNKVTNWLLPEHSQRTATKACASCHRGIELNSRDAFLRDGITFHEQWLALPDAEGSNARLLDSPDATNARSALAESAQRLTQRRQALDKATDAERPRALADATEAEATLNSVRQRLSLLQEPVQSSSELPWLQALQALQPTELPWPQPVQATEQLLQKYYRLRVVRTTVASDAEFLRRVSLDIRGVLPTKLEERYFAADKDPKKRERLLVLMAGTAKGGSSHQKFIDELLADPQVQSRWLEIWNARLADEERKVRETERRMLANDRLSRLLVELLDGGKTDEQTLDALCLATMARFPTATERKLILDSLRGSEDRRAKWDAVLRALSTTDEAKTHAEGLGRRAK